MVTPVSRALEHIVVVGSSLAGLRACETLRNLGFGDTITMVGAEAHLPYDRPPLSKRLLAGDWDPDRILLRKRDTLVELGLDLRLGVLNAMIDAPRSQGACFNHVAHDQRRVPLRGQLDRTLKGPITSRSEIGCQHDGPRLARSPGRDHLEISFSNPRLRLMGPDLLGGCRGRPR